jgi:dipeptidyl-peptidase-4
LDGKLVNKITDGEWTVKDIALVDEETQTIFFHATKENSTEKNLYKVKFNGNGFTKLTEGEGIHTCTVFENGLYFFDKFSSINHPTRLVLYNMQNNEQQIIADSKSSEMDNYKLGKVEMFTIPTEDGYDLPAKWFLPYDFDETKKYPIIFSIYGGPGSETVSNSFPRRGLGKYYLAQNGIIVIEIDNRGAGHFGKKGKDEMHRRLGTWEIDDLISAVKWLHKKPFIDSSKVAITGGSYGGYTTSMALARAGEYFQYGIAKYAVTDWRLYDNVYTERFMDTPEENPEGYKYGSVMNHAENYKGGMLITHGSLDDNVHMQNTIQLIDVLQNFDKEFELMIYPNQRHGIRYPKYPHSVKLDIDFWFKNLLSK